MPNMKPAKPNMLPISYFLNLVRNMEIKIVMRAIPMIEIGIPTELWALFRNNSNIR
jgi:hypothetical protein